MIKPKTIEVPKVDLYSPDGIHLGILNEYEFLDLRVQIKEAQISGYYVIFNGSKIPIDRNGTLKEYPIGLFDQLSDLYFRLM
jgi:hypothetical protein